jgi:2-succinyl-5-enolpyruvyl-6-hydroxy-3-cyclohexene-1-carboxylate synthase
MMSDIFSVFFLFVLAAIAALFTLTRDKFYELEDYNDNVAKRLHQLELEILELKMDVKDKKK